MAGDIAVVGALREDSSSTGVNGAPNEGAVDAGAAYVFVRSGSVWTQQAYLKPAAVGSTQAGDNFGTSVAVAGETIAVGAPGEDSSTTGSNSTPNEAASGAGAVYVFTRSGSVWSQQAYLKPAAVGTSQTGDAFGTSVALAGETLLVGAPGEGSSTTGVNTTPDEAAGGAGAGYVFVRSGSVWTQQAYLKPAAVGLGQAGDALGTSVSIAGDTAVLGAPFEGSSTLGVNAVPDEGATGAGAAYVFIRSGSVWTQQAFLKPSAVGSTQVFDNFGTAVAVSGDTAIVGAPGEDSGSTGIDSLPDESAANAGAAHVFAGLGPPSATPGNVTLAPAALAEHNAPGATVGTLSATYAGASGPHTFSLVPGAGDTDNAAFSISGSTLLINGRADFETKNLYSLRIRATDSGLGPHEAVVFVAVTNVNDPPSFVIGPNQVVPSTTSAQAIAGFVSNIQDGDGAVAQSLSFNVSVTSGAGLFSVAPAISSNGALTFTPVGVAGTATVSVTLTDDASIGGPGSALTTAAQTFSITFTDQVNLSALSLAGASLVPAFSPTTDVYGTTVPFTTDTSTVTATVAQAGATLQLQSNGGTWFPLASGSASSPFGFNVGANTVRVRATSADGSISRIYNVSVVRSPAVPGSPVFLTQTLDLGSGGQTGLYSSMTLVNGNPAIAFQDGTSQNLMYARNSAADGSGFWTVVVLETVGNAGSYASLAVVDGNPAIAYYGSSAGLKYIRANDANGTSWGPAVVADGATVVIGTFVSLAVVNGRPAISYYDPFQSFGGPPPVLDLKFVRALDTTGAAWGTPLTLDSAGTVGTHTTLTVVAGNPAVGYVDVTNRQIKYIRASNADGTAWGSPVAIETGDFAGYGGLTLLVVGGNPALSYNDVTNGNLRYVRATNANGSAWASSLNLDSTGTVGEFASLRIVNGRPAISYYDRTNGDLKFLRANDANGTSWPASGLTVASTGDVGRYTSLAIVAGNPAIAYQDTANGDLKFIRASNVDGTSWGAASTADAGSQRGIVGASLSQALVNGNPAVAYYDQVNRDLKYIRANDPAGTTWGAPVVVDSADFVGSNPSLVVVNGNPAVAYVDQTNSDLKFVRANDPNGTSWATPVFAESNASAQIGFNPSLAVVNGRPAIASVDSTNRRIRYVRAADANGTSWGAAVNASTYTELNTPYVSLAVVNGRPAIGHSLLLPGNDSDLNYVRANDADGTTWGTPVTVDAAGFAGAYCSLVVISGRPAIAYLAGGTSQALRFARAADLDGATWGTPVVLDSNGFGFAHASLAAIDGHPAIGYYEFGAASVKYVRASDPLGSSWGTPVVVDSAPINSAVSLIALGARPAIAYYEFGEGNLKWAALLLSPEIALAGNGNTIPNGDLTPDAVDHTDFGSVLAAGGGSIVRTFTVQNTGNGVLNLTGTPRVVVSGAQASDFTVTLAPAASVAAGGSTTFEVTFNPSAPGLRSAMLSLASDDADEGAFSFAVQGTGVNSAPSFSGYALYTPLSTAVGIGTAALLTRASDPDGGAPGVSLPATSSAQGGTVALNAGTVTYTPPTGFNGLDVFQVTISDAHGGSVSGLVMVSVGVAASSQLPAQITRLPGGDVALLFATLLPGQNYRIQSSLDLNAWSTLQTLPAAPDGTLPFVQPNPLMSKIFFRAITP